MSTMAMGFQDNDYSFDRRLSPGLTPWSSPATAMLYTNHFPAREYSAGEFVSTQLNQSVIGKTSPVVYQIVSPAVHAAGASCLSYTDNGAVHELGHPWIDTSGRLRIIYSWNTTGCSAGRAKVNSYYYNVSLASFTSSCSDGVWNGDETGIDCGGSCSPCASQSTGMTYEEKMKVLTGFVGFFIGALILWITVDW